MFKKCFWLLGLTSVVFVGGELPPRTPRDPSSLPILNKHASDVLAPRAQWTYRPQEDSQRHGFEGISHGSTLKAMVNSYERPNESGLSQEYWWQSPSWQNLSGVNYYGYSKHSNGYPTATSAGSGFSYKDPVEKIHSWFPYQQVRPTSGSHVAVKKIPLNYLKEKLQVQTLNASVGKPKYKKTALYQSPSNYKKVVFSRVAKPHAQHKYPAQSYPLYKRYHYQSPYQRYAIPSSEMHRYKDKSPSGGYYKASTVPPNQDPGRRQTTERMDDAYPDGSTTWEDYSAYNDTNHNIRGNYYEETDEEDDKTTSDIEESPHEEGTTRGYYGDRVYMSTQVPLITSDKTGVKNKYFIIRRISHDDDIETLFE